MYTKAGRTDLAATEGAEAEHLTQYVPALLSEAEIRVQLELASSALDPALDSKKVLGFLMKTFYTRVDKALVDSEVVKKLANEVMAALKH